MGHHQHHTVLVNVTLLEVVGYESRYAYGTRSSIPQITIPMVLGGTVGLHGQSLFRTVWPPPPHPSAPEVVGVVGASVGTGLLL